MDRKGVNAVLQFGRERPIDHAMALDPGLPAEGFRHDMNPEMRLPARPVARVPLVLVRFIDNAQA